MKCLQPRRITKNLDRKKYPDGIEIPCGQCMQCRIQKRELWVMRILHEFQYWEKSIFVTLTYSDEHLPENESLSKSDLQKFFKRLRKNIGDRKIKYFGCGEYGEECGRPHYHLIIFGLDFLNDEDIDQIKFAWPKCDWKMLGLKPFGAVTTESIRYTVSYLEKSIKGNWESYAYENVSIPFHVLSKGLGKRYALDNSKYFMQNCCINVGGHEKAVPRYYTDILGLSRDCLQSYAEEKEKKFVKDTIGLSITRDQAYRTLTPNEVAKIEGRLNRSRKQNDVNLKARDSIRARLKKRDT